MFFFSIWREIEISFVLLQSYALSNTTPTQMFICHKMRDELFGSKTGMKNKINEEVFEQQHR